MEAKICRGSWCLGFGLEPPATLEQVVKVLSAFGYDGIELAGFFDHATVERYPDKESRRKLVDSIGEHDLEIVGYAPGPYGDFGKYPWASGSDDVVAAYESFFDAHLQFCIDTGITGMRIDPGDFGPLARDVDYDRTWDRVVTMFRKHAERGAEVGVTMLWELETGQIFVKPSEAVKLFEDVGHDNLKLDVRRRARRGGVRDRPQPRPAGRAARGRPGRVRREDAGPNIGHMHVCDTDSNTWHNAFGTHLGIGKGGIDFDALVPASSSPAIRVRGGRWMRSR